MSIFATRFKVSHGEIRKTMQGSLPCLRADEPHGKAL